ncbi:hypothetical protein [Thalassomonas actiniarum]|uniref:Uncharacterized protein n=1 Tax=Thalassomonas actiniarum TaxID=485447 RepID=A0AAE9YUS3_9GAMM|nr:hypothetical protein [Thalassomonas actiniarum]WDE01616.1 hypothetical protein SG35_013925 [Thalassomonas actiniarum]
MKKLCLILSGYVLIGIICYSRLIQAHGYIPAAGAATSSSWEMLPLAELAVLLERGQLLGQSEVMAVKIKRQIHSYYHQEPGIKSAYLYAKVLQREHQFSQALNVLTSLLEKAPRQANARLLQANILMVQGFYRKAKQSCLALTGHIALTAVAICALDADSQALGQKAGQQAQLRQNYQSLINLLAKDKQPEQAILLWANQVLAEMALRLNRPLAAQQHLKGVALSRAPVSLIALWADIELALGHHDLVLTKLPAFAIQAQTQRLPDAILLRLAIAEKNSKAQTANNYQWQVLMAERVKLRESRRENDHGAQLARYYLDVKPDNKKAKHWAVINYQQAKMASDRALLDRALSQGG